MDASTDFTCSASKDQRSLSEVRSIDGTPPGGLTLSFAGCGFLGIYHVGAAACIRQHDPQLRVIKSIAGASAGAMAAACLISGANLGAIRSCIVKTAAEARTMIFGPLNPGYDMRKELEGTLLQVLPANAHEMVNGRLFISVTRVSDGKNIILSQFATREELVKGLLCSSFIPGYCGFQPLSFRGVRYIDGAFSDNMPTRDVTTVTVSPFSGEADVCPMDSTAGVIGFSLANTNFQFSLRNLLRFVHAMFPPSPESLEMMCQQGFDDTLNFLIRNNLVSCDTCNMLNPCPGAALLTKHSGSDKSISTDFVVSVTDSSGIIRKIDTCDKTLTLCTENKNLKSNKNTEYISGTDSVNAKNNKTLVKTSTNKTSEELVGQKLAINRHNKKNFKKNKKGTKKNNSCTSKCSKLRHCVNCPKYRQQMKEDIMHMRRGGSEVTTALTVTSPPPAVVATSLSILSLSIIFLPISLILYLHHKLMRGLIACLPTTFRLLSFTWRVLRLLTRPVKKRDDFNMLNSPNTRDWMENQSMAQEPGNHDILRYSAIGDQCLFVCLSPPSCDAPATDSDYDTFTLPTERVATEYSLPTECN